MCTVVDMHAHAHISLFAYTSMYAYVLLDLQVMRVYIHIYMHILPVYVDIWASEARLQLSRDICVCLSVCFCWPSTCLSA